MLWVDDRTGSKELVPHLRSFGIDAQIRRLDFGDFAWEGNGPAGLCRVAVERKTIGDLIQSMQSRRLSGHQLPGMADEYDYAYLIVEGIWRPSDEGVLEVGHGSFSRDNFGGRWASSYGKRQLLYRSIDNYLATLELHTGLIYRRTLSAQETVHVIADLYLWWRAKLWEDHSSHLTVYAPAEARGKKGRLNLVRREVSLAEAWAMQLPGIDKKAQEVAQRFPTGHILANALEEDWMSIPGIGKTLAKRAFKSIRERWNWKNDGL